VLKAHCPPLPPFNHASRRCHSLQVAVISDMPKKGVQSLRWSTKAQRLLVGSADHNLRVLGKQ